MKKIFVLAFASMSLLACNDNQTKSINDDTRDPNTTITEPAVPAPGTTTYIPVEGDVSYRDNKLHVWRNSAWVEADEDVKLDNGVIVYRTGKAKKDDKEIVLEDGVIINKEGNFFDKTGQAIENAWDATKEGVKDAGKEIEKGTKKAGDKIEDAVDKDDKYEDK